MKNLILCAAVLLATGGGVAFLVASHHATPPVAAAPPDTSAPPGTSAADPDAARCTECQTNAASKVYDVTDLSARFAVRSEAKGEFVSFDEPPLAKPKGELTPAKHEVAEQPREVLPPPREEK